MPSLASRLAVCSWSLQPDTPATLVQRLLDTGVKRVQIALDPLRADPGVWSETPQRLRDAGCSLVSGMFGTVGEDYSSLESIQRTGGIVPDATWEENWRNIQLTADLAARLGLRIVTFHAGFLPHDEADPAYEKLSRRLHQVADLFTARGIHLGLETGQETAATLAQFLTRFARPELGVNFDPANMLLYDKGDPIAALRQLGPWVKQVHLKDAIRTRVPGTWGDEVVVGTGEVDWRTFFAVLSEIGYTGDLCLEREAGHQRVADLRAGAIFVGGLVG
ncbi:MAG: sugar phosphate isomerase/epimerase [Verrucomicrobiae bacterium]|nr:sugar phosphate isomerase/epimerase [Verrucomicrobiae bacterium]